MEPSIKSVTEAKDNTSQPQLTSNMKHQDSRFFKALVAGAFAGASVDTILFPLDTLKTRLQSQYGFQKSGGFRGIYQGLTSAVIGSAPSAALFFATYDTLKPWLTKNISNEYAPSDSPIRLSLSTIHMISASFGETAACLVRVPTEVIKQRLQSGRYSNYQIAFKTILSTEGIQGFYRGFGPTILREIPFTCIQFPLFEYLKVKLRGDIQYSNQKDWKIAAIAGSLSGAIAAALTTPLDVIKTRIMLSTKPSISESPASSLPNSKNLRYNGFFKTFTRIIKEEGALALFKGILPRVLWLSVGGAIFLGSYELAFSSFDKLEKSDSRREV